MLTSMTLFDLHHRPEDPVPAQHPGSWDLDRDHWDHTAQLSLESPKALVVPTPTSQVLHGTTHKSAVLLLAEVRMAG